MSTPTLSRNILSQNTIRRKEIELPCQSAEADLWFAEQPSSLEQAKALCQECPLRAQCLEVALENAEPWGVWGGEIFSGGVVVARKRPRGRPRKNPAP
ncbi:WhiB family transcriptional regulator [Gordonia sp. HY002]|uniref:WhiB family transcriptional regulator n=1 Tax=Gordonia zhenghanii TaxID=2911516 RepID=UPI001EF0C208|nr:WhiB family transcriptional regulator [Gordonia zhenghanii]MCF8571193.1 WhiB family transcriptional regulator [Gordonia zhenghanii]MCF8606189.1 WhiB family transcriptional regulator [Gordonia zhenghanii]